MNLFTMDNKEYFINFQKLTLMGEQDYSKAVVLAEIIFLLRKRDCCQTKTSIFSYQCALLDYAYCLYKVGLLSKANILFEEFTNDECADNQLNLIYCSYMSEFLLDTGDLSRIPALLNVYNHMMTEETHKIKCEYFIFLGKYHYVQNHFVSSKTAFENAFNCYMKLNSDNVAVFFERTIDLCDSLNRLHYIEEAYIKLTRCDDKIIEIFGDGNFRHFECLIRLMHISIELDDNVRIEKCYLLILHYLRLHQSKSAAHLCRFFSLCLKTCYAETWINYVESFADTLESTRINTCGTNLLENTDTNAYISTFFHALAEYLLHKCLLEEALHYIGMAISHRLITDTMSEIRYLYTECLILDSLTNEQAKSNLPTKLNLLINKCYRYYKDSLPYSIAEIAHIEDIGVLSKCIQLYLHISVPALSDTSKGNRHAFTTDENNYLPSAASEIYNVILAFRNMVLSISSSHIASEIMCLPASLQDLHTFNLPNIAMEILTALPSSCYILEYFRTDAISGTSYDGAYYLFSLHSGKISITRLSNNVDRLISRLRILLFSCRQSDDRQFINVIEKLETCLLSASLREKLDDSYVTDIYIVPDSDLCGLSFELFPTLKRKELHYLNSGKDFLEFSNHNNGFAAQVSVISNPDFDFIQSKNLKSSSLLTKAAISATFSDDFAADLYSPYIDIMLPQKEYPKLSYHFANHLFQMSETSSLSILADASAYDSSVKNGKFGTIMYIYTHGEYLLHNQTQCNKGNATSSWLHPYNPLYDSFLVMTGVNHFLSSNELVPGIEDGIINAEDIRRMKLSNTYLVVLAGCMTGLGKPLGGESMLGMRLALFAAGAKAIIVSLWPVNESATLLLMSSFHSNIMKGLTVAESLRAAKLEVCNNKAYSHPYYYSGFICIGDDSVYFSE